MTKRKGVGGGATAWVSIDDMERDPEFQRDLDEKRAQQIAAYFNPDAFGIISLSGRDDGKFVILDGQHRIEALRVMGWNGQKVECHVFRDLDRKQEAQRFLDLNNFKQLRYIDRFMSRLAAHDVTAVPIAKIVQDAGYIIDRSSRDGVITAAKALEDVYLGRGQRVKGANPAALRKTLAALTSAWGRTRAATSAPVIAGVGAFFLRYGTAVDTARLTAKLTKIIAGPSGLVARGMGKRELHGGTVASGIGHYLTDEYNRGARGKNRLPGWRESDA
jgi:hypothetical protein